MSSERGGGGLKGDKLDESDGKWSEDWARNVTRKDVINSPQATSRERVTGRHRYLHWWPYYTTTFPTTGRHAHTHTHAHTYTCTRNPHMSFLDVQLAHFSDK